MEKVCRLCLEHDNEQESVTQMKNGLLIADMIEKITSVHVEDEAASKICSSCLEIITTAYELRLLSIKNDKYLRELHTVKEEFIVEDLIKYEPIDDEYTAIETTYEEVVEADLIHQDSDDTHEHEHHLCDICGESRCRKEDIREHIHRKHLSKNCCIFCSKIFTSPAILSQHITRKHPNAFSCPKCPSLKFKTKKKSEKHAVIHQYFAEDIYGNNNKNIYQCMKCLKQVENTGDKLYDHIYYHRKIQSKSIGGDRSGSFSRARDDSESLVCPHCGVMLKSKQILNQHIRRHFDTGEKYPCTSCPQKFKSYSELYYHKSVHQTGKAKYFFLINFLAACCVIVERPFQCDICLKSFKARRLLKIHKARHVTNIKNFSCSYCDLKLKTKYTLNRHISSIHAGLKPHSCEYCDKSFAQKNELVIRRI